MQKALQIIAGRNNIYPKANSSLQLRIKNTKDMENARQTVERVLKVQSNVSSEGVKIIAPMADANKVTDLLIAFRESGIQLAELSVQKPTLDEVFLNLTGHGVEDTLKLPGESGEVGEVGI